MPQKGPVEAERVRGSINLSCCGFAVLDEIIESEKKDKEQQIVILPPLGLSYYVLTPRNV
jgi:hypothetical protein